MASSEDLVPKDQPYGQRQESVAAMRQANLPLSSSGVPAVGGVPAVSHPFRRARPDYDALLETVPPPLSRPQGPVPQQGVMSPADITDLLMERLSQSANSFDRAVAARLAALREG